MMHRESQGRLHALIVHGPVDRGNSLCFELVYIIVISGVLFDDIHYIFADY